MAVPVHMKADKGAAERFTLVIEAQRLRRRPRSVLTENGIAVNRSLAAAGQIVAPTDQRLFAVLHDHGIAETPSRKWNRLRCRPAIAQPGANVRQAVIGMA